MSLVSSAASLDRLASDLFARPRYSLLSSSLGWLLALVAHALVAGFAVGQRLSGSPAPPPLEVELVAPPPPPAPPEPPPLPEPLPEAPAKAPVTARASSPPPAARAGALHTAKDDPNVQPEPEGPLDFTHDPSVTGFGAGVVAIGGKAAFGAPGAALTPPSPAPSAARPATGSALVPLADLRRKPALGEADPCRGYFPRDAFADAGSASVLVVIKEDGTVAKSTLLSESPSGQGFGRAGRACMAGKRFVPALDQRGRPAATAIRINLRFTR